MPSLEYGPGEATAGQALVTPKLARLALGVGVSQIIANWDGLALVADEIDRYTGSTGVSVPEGFVHGYTFLLREGTQGIDRPGMSGDLRYPHLLNRNQQALYIHGFDVSASVLNTVTGSPVASLNDRPESTRALIWSGALDMNRTAEVSIDWHRPNVPRAVARAVLFGLREIGEATQSVPKQWLAAAVTAVTDPKRQGRLEAAAENVSGAFRRLSAADQERYSPFQAVYVSGHQGPRPFPPV